MSIVLVTGCSSGIGFLTSLGFARQGHTTVASLRNLDKAEPLPGVSTAERDAHTHAAPRRYGLGRCVSDARGLRLRRARGRRPMAREADEDPPDRSESTASAQHLLRS